MNKPINRIMVYLDGSEQSITAAQYAIALCKDTGASLFGVYIINTRALNDLVKSHIFIKSEEVEYQHDLEADAEKYLKYFKELAHQKGLGATTVKESGTVQIKVKELILENEIDLLVIGELSRIRSRRDEFFTDTEKIMRYVPCSVLIVKDEDFVEDIYKSI